MSYLCVPAERDYVGCGQRRFAPTVYMSGGGDSHTGVFSRRLASDNALSGVQRSSSAMGLARCFGR